MGLELAAKMSARLATLRTNVPDAGPAPPRLAPPELGRSTHSTAAPASPSKSASTSAICRDVRDPQFAESFGAFLADHKAIDPAIIDRARRACRAAGERFDQVLTKLGLLSDSDVVLALSNYLAIPIVTSAQTPSEPILTEIIDADFVRRNKTIPLATGDAGLTVGVADPFNDEPIRALAYLTGLSVIPCIFTPAEFDKIFDRLYAHSRDASGSGADFSADASEVDVQRLRDLASEAPTIRLVNQIIGDAVEAGASDIHIEPTIDVVLVRHRIDGVLRTAQTLPPGARAAVTSRVKIVSKLDIAERRLPQDGRIKIAVRGVDIDFRISTIPTAFGESVVMRIRDRSRVELDFAKLGFEAAQIALLQELIEQPNGIILVTGPTGSGKSTTLYTALKMLNHGECKIFTVEDPIEYQLTGIDQVQVHPSIGLTFPHALRSILRQDPDVIMIGEIRDLETARIAIQAALTGHLVLSTLHTNSAAATIARMVDMGVESYLLASTIRGVIAQRLVRRLCQQCSRAHENAAYWIGEISERLRDRQALGPPDIRQAAGCSHCAGTGYSGRTTISEILPVDAEMHRLILARASEAQMDDYARQRGISSMYESGVVKVWQGRTTIEEVLGVTRAIC